MTQSAATLTELLTWLAGPGAGVVGSLLFDRLRGWLPLPTRRAWNAARSPQRWLWTLLHAPAWAQWTAPGLAALLGILATAGLAALQGAPALEALDMFVAALAAGLFALLTHSSRKRSTTVEVRD
jgi:hypothetical protein